jgi:hypothetical protein
MIIFMMELNDLTFCQSATLVYALTQIATKTKRLWKLLSLLRLF